MEREGEEEASSGKAGKRERKPKKAQERSETQNKKHTSKTKKWEKRLNENYFKLFRRRWNRKAEKQIQKQTTTKKTTKKTKNVSVREKAERRWRPCWAPFCNGSQERSRVALEHVDEGTRIGEGQNTRTRLTPSPLFKHSVLGTFDYYLFFCQNHQDRNL